MSKLPSSAGSEGQDPDYQYLSEIQTSMDMTSAEYEYPLSLDNTPPPCPSPPDHENQPGAGGSQSEQPIYENVASSNGHLPPIADDSDIDSDYSEVEHDARIRIHSKKKERPHNGSELENSSKIYVQGHLPDYHSSIDARLRSVSQLDELVSSVSEQGIYQGLAMTDQDKEEIGIMPECVYMATNLLENLAEQLNVVEEMETLASGEEDVGSRLGSKTDPNVFKPKIRRQLQHRASAPTSAQLPTSPQAVVVPRYRNYLIRPPPLPPISQQATLAERKAYSAVESLLKSEAALLSSLHIAIQVYMRPLKELSLGPSPILSKQQVATLFGPIEQILSAQELFYSALTSRTLAWNTEQKIGDVFLSSLATKEVIRSYSTYVNNFTAAISVLEQGLKKKVKFISFLKEKYKQSNTSLSLQGLLLKPIQRFPQYILFIQDLLKYTAHNHPDRITLQMSLARFEGIADYLNESKRATEQKSIVEYLNTRVSKLPFRLTDSRSRWLHRQDVVTRLFANGSSVKKKKRYLLLFNNIILCAAPNRKTQRQEEMEGTTGSKLFRAVDGTYRCKWHVPVDSLEVLEPDYQNDIWDYFVDSESGLASTNVDDYKQAKSSTQKLEHDFTVMVKIASSIAKLHHDYEGLTTTDVNTHIRVLQRKLARVKEQIESHQAGRLDISIPTKDGTRRVTHTYVFPNKRVKDSWINTLRFTKLKLNRSNKNAWVTSEDTNDEDFFDLSHKLPLLVESYRLSMLHTLNSINCGARVGDNSAWLASGSQKTAQITIVECVTPAPLVLESFNVESSRVMAIVYVPPATHCDATLTATMKRVSLRDTLKNMGTLTNLPPHLPTVWMGAECGKLLVYSSDSIEDGTKRCLSSIKFNDAITSLQYYNDKVIISTAEGSVTIFQRNMMGWNLGQKTTISVLEGVIRCTCLVKSRLWVGAANICYFVNLQTRKVEGHLEMSSDSQVVVSRMVCWGEGIWVSYKGSSTLELFHTVTKTSLQSIDVKSTLHSTMKRRDLLDRYPVSDRVHVTALLVSPGYFWIGTSVGIIMVYRIPLIEGVPLITAKPYLAMDGHKGQVRVILTVKTQATVSSLRVNQFLKAEQRQRYSTNLEEEEHAQALRAMEATDGETPSPESTFPASIREEDLLETLSESGGFDERDEDDDDFNEEDNHTLVRSATPSLPHPSTLEFSVDSTMEQSMIPAMEASYDEFDGLESNDTSQMPLENQTPAKTPRGYTIDDRPRLDTPDGQPMPGLTTHEVELQDITTLRPISEIETIGVEDILANRAASDFTDSKDFDMSLPNLELIPSTGVEQSLDFLATPSNKLTLHHPSSTAHEASTGDQTKAASDQPVVHHVQDLQEIEDTDLYAPICKETLLSNQKKVQRIDTITAVEKHRCDKGIYLLADDSLDGYHDPVELDSVTKRVLSDELSGSEGESNLDNVILRRKRGEETLPTPYEDPVVLDRAGPNSASKVFTSTLVRDSQPTVPGRPKGSKEGAIFVLTCGRGLIDLRYGAKTNVLFPMAKDSVSQEDRQTEGCMLAYEIEQ